MTATHESTRKLVHVHSISFNSNRTFFTVCLEEGLRIYQTDPLELYQCLSWSTCGSVRVAEQLDSSCAVIMAGGGKRPKMPDNVAMLYNFVTNVFGARFKVPSPILNLLIRDEKLVVVMQREIEVYDVCLFPLSHIRRGVTYTTCVNDKGLCQMSRDLAEQHVLCYPGTTEGSVQIVGLSGPNTERGVRSLIRAHKSELQCLSLSQDGLLLATASKTGTLIRLWCTSKHSKLMEFRRGIDQALIYDIDISADNMFMACVSDKRTVHVFALKNPKFNVSSNLSGLGPRASYTESLWGMAQFSLHGLVDCKISVMSDSSVIVVTEDGRYYKYLFARDGHTPQCQRLAYELYTDLAPQVTSADEGGTGGDVGTPTGSSPPLSVNYLPA